MAHSSLHTALRQIGLQFVNTAAEADNLNEIKTSNDRLEINDTAAAITTTAAGATATNCFGHTIYMRSRAHFYAYRKINIYRCKNGKSRVCLLLPYIYFNIILFVVFHSFH